MRRTRTIRLSQEDLQGSALSTPHEFQHIAIKSLIEHNWRVSSVNWQGNVCVIVMRLLSDDSIGCAVYPDGSFARSREPKVKWSWNRAVAASTATIPDVYVQNILNNSSK